MRWHGISIEYIFNSLSRSVLGNYCLPHFPNLGKYQVCKYQADDTTDCVTVDIYFTSIKAEPKPTNAFVMEFSVYNKMLCRTL